MEMGAAGTPQMPYMNNLDHLAIFPMMSKHHSALLKNYSFVQAPPKEIWCMAKQVLLTNSSWRIALPRRISSVAAKTLSGRSRNFTQQ
jgi:hypothetical protein